jgi:prepilin peptidase CpaA
MPVTFAIALAVCAVACATDLAARRIPNILTVGSALAGVAYHAVDSGASGAATALLGWLAGIAVFFVPFVLRGMGGGDVKLMGALGAWLGAAGVVWVALYTGVAGGVLALAVAAYRGYLRQALDNVSLLLMHWRVAGPRRLDEITLEHSRGPKLAYAIPIFVGTLVAAWRHS